MPLNLLTGPSVRIDFVCDKALEPSGGDVRELALVAHSASLEPKRSQCKLKRFEYFLIPAVVCLAVFWRAPFVWFRTDDFAWLGLRLEVHNFKSLLHALFRPEAEGTVRVPQ